LQKARKALSSLRARSAFCFLQNRASAESPTLANLAIVFRFAKEAVC